MAKEIVGMPVKDAPPKAGLLIQHYPCRASRGDLGGIHESGELHKQAFIKALEDRVGVLEAVTIDWESRLEDLEEEADADAE